MRVISGGIVGRHSGEGNWVAVRRDKLDKREGTLSSSMFISTHPSALDTLGNAVLISLCDDRRNMELFVGA